MCWICENLLHVTAQMLQWGKTYQIYLQALHIVTIGFLCTGPRVYNGDKFDSGA